MCHNIISFVFKSFASLNNYLNASYSFLWIYFQFVVDREMQQFFENKRIDLFEGGTKEYK